ncbi:tRNA lysidine(34) synthetase TilS [Rickettsiales bacterium (ex Bugula neritina AB1)]|nr:tRNA lysidine(34) synthetase TilS [Rickettsiales bacterium (ex Bugula neritina AB1)]
MNFDLLKNSSNIAVAFSGGKDSTFLLLHTFDWCKKNNKKFFGAIIINHNLRENIREEINNLKKYWCSSIKIEVIEWTNPIKSQKHARNFRLNSLSFFAIKNNIDTILLGHNLEDKIYTFFLRKERNSSEWGLASISSITIINTIKFIRPILSVSEDYIYDFLKKKQIFYVKDPSNDICIYRRNYLRKNLSFNYNNTLKNINYYGKERQIINNYIQDWIKKYFHQNNLFSGGFFLHNLPKELEIYSKILGYIINIITGNIVSNFEIFQNFFHKNTEVIHGCVFHKSYNLFTTVITVYKSYKYQILDGEGIWQKTFLLLSCSSSIYVENNKDLYLYKSYINPNIPLLNKTKPLILKKEKWNNIIINHILPNYICTFV